MPADIAGRACLVVAWIALHLEVDAQPRMDFLEPQIDGQVREVEVILLAVVRADESKTAALFLLVDLSRQARAWFKGDRSLRGGDHRRRRRRELTLSLLLMTVEFFAAGVAEERLTPARPEI